MAVMHGQGCVSLTQSCLCVADAGFGHVTGGSARRRLGESLGGRGLGRLEGLGLRKVGHLLTGTA